MDDDLQQRIRRIYAAVDATEDADLGKFPPAVVWSAQGFEVAQDWSGGASSAQIENDVHTAIHNVANLRDHLRRAAARLGFAKEAVDVEFESSVPLQLVLDLSNNDKHGYPPRDGGRSKLSPRIQNVFRAVELSPGASGGTIELSLGLDGQRVSGTGTARVVTTGVVVDGSDSYVADLRTLIAEAIVCWESFLDRILPGWRQRG